MTLAGYYQAGFSVIPLRGKKPRIARYPDYSYRRPTDIEIAEWSAAFPNCNLGIPTGPSNRICIIDIDDPAYWSCDMFPLTVTVESRPGRYQLWYRFPVDIPSLPRKIKLFPGLDFLGSDGYGILPPSIHPDTRTPYRFTQPIGTPIPVVPSFILDALRRLKGNPPVGGGGGRRSKRSPSGGRRGFKGEEGGAVTQRAVQATDVKETMRSYAERAVMWELVELRRIPLSDGNGKNARLNRSAFKLGQLLHLGLNEQEVIAQLMDIWVGRWKKPEPIGRATIMSGLTDGKDYPRPLKGHQ